MLKNPSTSKIDKYYQDKEEKLEKIFVKDIRSRKNTTIYMVVNATKIKDKKNIIITKSWLSTEKNPMKWEEFTFSFRKTVFSLENEKIFFGGG